MAEWKKQYSEYLLMCGVQDAWEIRLGKVTVILSKWQDETYQCSIGAEFGYITAESPEAAPAAALSWARGVLGAALVEAGAATIESGICELCGAIGPGEHCGFCSDKPMPKFSTMRPAKFARVGS